MLIERYIVTFARMHEEQRYLPFLTLKAITCECEHMRSQSVFLTYDRTY